MNTETTMSHDFALAVMDQALRHAEDSGRVILSGNLRSARTAVAALIEREAALVASDAAKSYQIKALMDERGSLAERVKALEAFAGRFVSITNCADYADWKTLARDPNRKVAAIKACRSAHGLSLREAKDCVDVYLETLKAEARNG